MGLDMYAFSVARTEIKDEAQQTDVVLNEGVKPLEFFYWRKHHDLHGWMEKLYRRKGGDSSDFNCNTVRLTSEDLDALEQAVKEEGAVLPVTTGFFFGNNPPDLNTQVEDLKFINKARELLSQDRVVFYDSWW